MARETTKPKNRWLPWLVVLGMFIVLVVYTNSARRQSRGREAVLALGGRVWNRSETTIGYFVGSDGGTRIFPGEARKPVTLYGRLAKWLQERGSGYDVIAAEVRGQLITRGSFPIDSLNRVEWLNLATCRFPGGVIDVRRFASQVRFLYLRESNLSDEGLIQVSQLSQVEVLDLSDTAITDAGLAYLKRMPKLERLDLSNTRITDAGLNHLIECPSLTAIRLQETEVTYAGVQTLGRLPPLRELDLFRTGLSAAQFKQLRTLLPTVKIHPLRFGRFSPDDWLVGNAPREKGTKEGDD
ncbi:MAG: leucine-rich repeat domain-containing protein [Planctomycetota bacterium]|jgi:hypothetical protein